MTQLLFPKDDVEAKLMAKQAEVGKLKRVRQGIYADADWSEIPKLLHNRWYEVVEHLFDDAIASHVTAVELRPVNNTIFVTANIKHRKKVRIADTLTIEVFPGDTRLLTEQFVPGLRRSAPARYLLENLQPARLSAGSKQAKAYGKAWVESELCKWLERRGERELNRFRDEARKYCQTLNMAAEFVELDKLIGALLSTRSIESLDSRQAIAVAKKEPYDVARLKLFEQLVTYLGKCELREEYFDYTASAWRNQAFFESYFSNFIEGTEFEIDEAEDIVFARQVMQGRHEDSHDVISVFELVSDYQEMITVADSAGDWLTLIQQRHAHIMQERPDKRPGLFKLKPNKAGDSYFVSPDQLEGTLNQAFDLCDEVPAGLKRAIYVHFVLAECHPFDDGNGRLARVMMNAELAHQEMHKILVPTVHRDSYLNGLRSATRGQGFRTMVKVLAQLHGYSAILPWSDYGELRQTLEAHHAHKLPDDGVPRFNRQLIKFPVDLPR